MMYTVDERRGDQHRLAAERILIGLRRAGKCRLDRRRQSDLGCRGLGGVHGVAERGAGLRD